MIFVAHRGASAYEPENTLLSFKRGIELGGNTVEFDIRKSKDGEIVIMHDAELDRTTNGSGKVNDYTLEELKKLDAGKGEKIPTLKEALDFLNGKCHIAIELKEDDLEEAVVSSIKGIKNVIVISFGAHRVKKIKQLSLNTVTGFIFNKPIKNIEGFLRLNKSIKAEWLLGRADILTKELIDKAHDWGFNVLVWVLDDVGSIKKFKSLKVDGIASNKPDLFKK